MIVRLAALAVAALAPIAAADLVQVDYTGSASGSNIRILHPQLPGGEVTTFVGQGVHAVSGGVGGFAVLNGTSTTYSPDFLQPLTPDPASFTPSVLGSIPLTTNPAVTISEGQAQAIADIYGAFASEVLDTGVINRKAVAFQLLIWEILTDYDPAVGVATLDVNAGDFTALRANGTPLSADLIAEFETYRGAIGSGASLSPVFGVTHPDFQDQLIYVPAPGACALLALGGLATARRRR